MKFGIIEAKAFCENHEDIRVKLVWKWLCECRSKNAQWCDALEKEKSKVRSYEDFLDSAAPPSTSGS
jgi:hypothetical protein